MQIQLTPQAEAILKSLLTEETSAEQLVEFALVELADRHDDEMPQHFIDPRTNQVLTEDELRAELGKGLNDIEEGRVAPLDIDDIRQRGQQRIAAAKKKSH